ncbi:MAG TPA: type II toxin-antitoxin system HigB family toxin [Puia sp.]|jgi:mRNA interferase HigB
MKVHLIKRETIEAYMVSQARSRPSFEDWLEKIKRADWINPDDIKKTFNSADPLGNGSDRIVFDIAGNNYRMIAKYWFGSSKIHLYIKWIGTHAEYTALCKKNQHYSVDKY